MTFNSSLLPSNHRKGRSALQPRKPQSPSACPMETVWASASTGLTTVVCVRTDGAARHAAHALYPWPLSAQTASVSRDQSCSSSHVNAATTAATSMKWPFLHSTGCTEIHTSSQTSTEEGLELTVNFLDEWRRYRTRGFFLTWLQEERRPQAPTWLLNCSREGPPRFTTIKATLIVILCDRSGL